jgi:hypothetical protein
LAAAHVDDSELGGDHIAPPALTVAPVAWAPAIKVLVPAVTPRSAGHDDVLRPAPSNDHPPKMTPGEAHTELLNAHVSLATV